MSDWKPNLHMSWRGAIGGCLIVEAGMRKSSYSTPPAKAPNLLKGQINGNGSLLHFNKNSYPMLSTVDWAMIV